MDCEQTGINYTVQLSYAAIDGSGLSYKHKREILFAVYSFRCLFDNEEMLKIDPTLKKYGCTFEAEVTAHPDYGTHKAEFESIIAAKGAYAPHGGILLYGKDGRPTLRFDAGSEVWGKLVANGKITGDNASVPIKPSLYRAALDVVSLKGASDELKAMWYLIFPYVMLIGAPHESEIYYKLKEKLCTDKVFDAVLSSRYGVGVADSVKELWAAEMPNTVIDWLAPYIEYKNEKNEKGVSRDVARYQKWLAAGRFAEVFAGTEKLLDTFPDDNTLLLTNIAARISLDTVKNNDEREKLLENTIEMIESVLSEPNEKKAFFLYYHALALVGLKRLDEALDKLDETLDFCPNFESALLMKRAIKDAIEKAGE